MKSNLFLFRILYAGAILLFALSLFSCKTSYEAGMVKAKPMSDNRLYSRVVDSSMSYSSFNVKRFTASYKLDGLRKNFKGSIRIQKDSVIWISLTDPLMGVEGVRLLITPDSLKFINRLQKEFFVGDFSYLNNELGMYLDFYTLQSILTNSVFDYDREDDRPFVRKFKGKVVDNKYVFNSFRERRFNRKLKKEKLEKLYGVYYQRFEIDPDLYRITSFFMKQFDTSRSISIRYSDFKIFDNQKCPRQMLVKINDTKHLLSCKIKFNKISLNQDLNFGFKISDKYQRISK